MTCRARKILTAFLAFAIVASVAANADPPTVDGDYRRVILVSWDGVRRDVLHEMLTRTDPDAPCWEDGDVLPQPLNRNGADGRPLFTCLPALAGLVPNGHEGSAHGAFQIIASHATNDGKTFTKPQHASMLTGYAPKDHGLTGNTSKRKVPRGVVLYERLMDAFDPRGEDGKRNGKIFRTHHSGSKKFVGRAIYFWAGKTKALQTATGRGNEKPGNPGPLRHAEKSFKDWTKDAETSAIRDFGFFMFLHFKLTDWAAHLGGQSSPRYRQALSVTDARLHELLELLDKYGLDDAAVIVTTDHGFHRNQHARSAGRHVFNTWIAAHNVELDLSGVSVRTGEDYCNSQISPIQCRIELEQNPMPEEDAVPNVYITQVAPTILDMFGVEWRDDPKMTTPSLFAPRSIAIDTKVH